MKQAFSEWTRRPGVNGRDSPLLKLRGTRDHAKAERIQELSRDATGIEVQGPLEAISERFDDVYGLKSQARR